MFNHECFFGTCCIRVNIQINNLIDATLKVLFACFFNLKTKHYDKNEFNLSFTTTRFPCSHSL